MGGTLGTGGTVGNIGERRFLQNLPGLVEVFFIDLDTDSADGIRIKPIQLHHILILDISRHAACLQSQSQQMRLFRFADMGNRGQGHGQIYNRNRPD